jgi:hypothetical protein
MEATKTPAFSLSRRIGQTYYTVNVRFNDHATQTMEEKLLHMIQNETVDFDENCGIIPYATNEPSV